MILFSFIPYLICKTTNEKYTEIQVSTELENVCFRCVFGRAGAADGIQRAPPCQKVDMIDISYFRYSYRAFL